MNTDIYRDVKISLALLLSVIGCGTIVSQNQARIYKFTSTESKCYLQLNDDSTFVYRDLVSMLPLASDMISKGIWSSNGDTITLCSDDTYAAAPIISSLHFDYFVHWVQFNGLKLIHVTDSTWRCYPFQDAVVRFHCFNRIKAYTKLVCYYDNGHPNKYMNFDKGTDVRSITWTLTLVEGDSTQSKFINHTYKLLEWEEGPILESRSWENFELKQLIP